MGGQCTTSYTELPAYSDTTAGSDLPDWYASSGRSLFENAAAFAEEGYSAFPGSTQATYDGDYRTPEERQAAGILTDGASSYEPFYTKAANIAERLGGGYDSMSRDELLGNDFQGLSREEIMGNYEGATRDELLGNYEGATRDELLGNYEGATREELLGNYQGATREELLGDPFSLESAQPFMDIYQNAMDPAVREIEKQTAIAQNAARAKASTGGGGFGSRLGLLEATTGAEGAQLAGDLRAGAAREGLTFASGRYDTDRAARASTEDRMRGQFLEDRTARASTEDRMRGQFLDDRSARASTEDTMRGRFLDDQSSRFSAEDRMRDQFLEERTARAATEDAMYGRYGDQRDARFSAEDTLRSGYETDQAALINQMNSYEGLGSDIMNLQNQAAQGLITAGEARRSLDQKALDIAQAEFLDEKEYPREQLNFALSALGGTPYNTTNRTYGMSTSYQPNTSVYGQAIGAVGQLASGAASIYKTANT
tara:strand:+ start:57 stop:1511 length:1455 start_codon:yes stop_codon:yes gene_type:complete